MSEERMKVLSMLAEGKISAEEADRLLSAVEEPAAPAASDGVPRYLYVKVDPKEGGKESDQVNIRVPLALVKAGINLANLLPEEAREGVEDALGKKGVDLDLKNIKGQDLDAILIALQELQVDVDTVDTKVRIYTG